ncbi:DUF4224 domain-containing protein [Pseudoduganella violacea]|uniref:DUF4224 domain-containing protein n=1 Tax=Pseudoduganella violacea TaxID=1715466 RepID=A0A7W5B981_9BURK|nr:DUF4224 domain-containing protein [Pseudoduganella violacea]MBB3118874.1 hypothetical protein [Pseudoduganella violacea]
MKTELIPEGIYDITHYRRAHEQLRALKELGIPARRRHDNTVCVLRMHTMAPTANLAAPGPTLKSSGK